RVEPGDLLTYAVTVINAGPGIAKAVNLTETLPAGTTFFSARSTAGSCTAPAAGQTGTFKCNVDSIARYTSWSVRLTVRVTAKAGPTLSNTASVTSSTPDPKLLNNSATVITKVVVEQEDD